MPTWTTLNFKNVNWEVKLPFVIYIDIEALLKPLKRMQSDFEDEHKKESNVKLDEHVPLSCGYYIVSTYANLQRSYEPIIFTSRRPKYLMQKFLKALQFEACIIYNKLQKFKNVMPDLTEEQERNFLQQKVCPRCLIAFDEGQVVKVRHHCHFTGKYLGVLCSKCNLNYRTATFIPVIAHNLKNYDAMFLCRALTIDEEKVEVIPKSTNKYLSFSKFVRLSGTEFIQLRFIDSFQFCSASLDALVNNLSRDQLHHVSRFYEDDTKFSLMIRKGVFAYNYLDNYRKLKDTRLPSQQAFFNVLTQKHVSDDDYKHALLVWQTFNLRTLCEYLELYLRTDILLLADCFENYRQTSLETFMIDPRWTVSSPSFSWNAMLRYTDIKLDLITDLDMYRMLESSIRGGVTFVSKKWASANNKYMRDYDPSKPSSYIIYIDQNSLYANAMSQPLPYKNFRFLSSSEIDELMETFLTIPLDNEFGYILEVDIRYPEQIHDTHNAYPFLPERKVPLLSTAKVEKLLCTLDDKGYYVIHYRYLQLAIKHGLEVTKVHRVLCFEQKAWLKPYIDVNIEKRKLSSNKFDSDYFKLLPNSIFGRSILNKRKFRNVRLHVSPKTLERAVKKATFASETILDENIVAVESYKETVMLDSTVYIGFTVLDLSKVFQYEWFYEHLPHIFSKASEWNLLYTDTDSFILEVIGIDDIFDTFIEHKQYFDLSNFPQSHKCFDATNQMKLGMMKEESKGRVVCEYVGLKAKMYSLKYEDESDYKRMKGITKSVLANKITFNDYKACYEKHKSFSHTQCTIKAEKFRLFTLKSVKKSLDFYDDKRILLENATDTSAYGHYKVKDLL